MQDHTFSRWWYSTRPLRASGPTRVQSVQGHTGIRLSQDRRRDPRRRQIILLRSCFGWHVQRAGHVVEMGTA